MARRSIKIPPKAVDSTTSSEEEKYDDVLHSLDTIQTKRKNFASSNEISGKQQHYCFLLDPFLPLKIQRVRLN
ncbi:MAG: hypothetical protein ACW99R_11095 [Candidatus Hodarchaeales archaeon]|jgi:hypothetical protein